MNELVAYLRNTFQRFVLRSLRASILVNERTLSNKTKAFTVTTAGLRITQSELKIFGDECVVYLRAITNDIYLLRGVEMRVLTGGDGELISATAPYPTPIRIRKNTEDWYTVAPTATGTLLVMCSSESGDGLDLPGFANES